MYIATDSIFPTKINLKLDSYINLIPHILVEIHLLNADPKIT
ncbi:hypothetical protein [Methanosarcina barkeri]|nr:hypothetical protein [Methanosarcina barkeri]